MGATFHSGCTERETRELPRAVAGSTSATQELDYCDVKPIFVDKCVRCHGGELVHGEPFRLETYDSLYRRRESIQRSVSRRTMPDPNFLELTPPVEPLTEQEFEDVLSWLSEGALQGECD